MAFPVILGIPWLAGVLGGLFSVLFGYLGQYLTKKLAIVLVLVTMIVSAVAAFMALMKGIMLSLSSVSPDWLGQAISLVVPDNASMCVSAIVTAHIARWAYEWNVRIIQYKLL